MKMLPSDWSHLRFLHPNQFKHPMEMERSIVFALDRFIGIVGIRPKIISGFRPGDPKQHGLGTAIDTIWPGQDPLRVWELARNSREFSGLGIYLNEKNAVSFHFDTRVNRLPSNPALWGDLITREPDPDTGRISRVDTTVTVDFIIEKIKGNGLTLFGVALIAIAAWRTLQT